MQLRRMEGETYGRLTVLEHARTKRWETSKQTQQFWICQCVCGNRVEVNAGSLRNGRTTSCGCLRKETAAAHCRARPRNNKGLSTTPEYKLWSGARERAVKFNREFDLEVSDVVIPKHCPVLGIPLFKGKGKQSRNSPTLDRRNSTKGYTKDNVCVISLRANSLKQDADVETLEKVIRYIKGESNQ